MVTGHSQPPIPIMVLGCNQKSKVTKEPMKKVRVGDVEIIIWPKNSNH